MKKSQYFLMLIIIFNYAISLSAAQEQAKKRSQEFLHGDTPTNVLLFWSYGLNFEKYDKHRHVIEHVYDDHVYKSLSYDERIEAVNRCLQGSCSVLPSKIFKVYPRHIARYRYDRLQNIFCGMCKKYSIA